MGFGSLRELQRFVGELRVPDARREVVESELLDHFFARIGEGASEAEALAAFGSADALRVRFEGAERSFAFTRADALRDGVRFGAGLFLALAASDAVVSIVLDALFGLLRFDPARRFWLFWLVLKHAANPLVWSLAVVVPLAVFHRVRPRRRGAAAEGKVAIQAGATLSFLLLAAGIGLAGALWGEDLGAWVLTRVGIEAANPDASGRLLDLGLWLLATALALFHLPRRGGVAHTSESEA